MNVLNKEPFFSVVIPLYNKANFIKDTIESIFDQTFIDFEIIVIDDGSTDESVKLISKYNDDRLSIFTQKNAGASIARNNGIARAKGKYIALLDADDYWYTNHLFELNKLILLYPNAGLYCNNYEVFYSESLVKPAQLNFEYDKTCLIVKDFFKASVTQPVAWTSAVGFTKADFISVAGFDSTLKTAQDLDLWIKMALKFDVAFNPKITMSYKLYIEDSLSANEYNTIRYNFNNSYREEEKSNPSLKLYLDINRYALAIRSLLNNEDDLYKKLKKEIDYKNLNFKQKLLLNFPKFLLRISKKFHLFLMKNGFYFSAYK